MKRFGVAMMLIASLSVSVLAYARNCEDDSIEEVAGDGAILTMLSGSIWKVDEADRVDSGLWLGTEDVLICEDSGTRSTIINKEESGEEVHAERIGSE